MLLKRVLALFLCLALIVTAVSCGKGEYLSPDKEITASDSKKESDDIPKEIEEEAQEEEEIFVEQPISSTVDYDDIESEILSQQVSKPSKDEKDGQKDKNETQPAIDKNAYIGKDYGDEPITRENLDFDGKTVTIMREWAPFESGKTAAGDRFLTKAQSLEKKHNVKIEQKQWKVTLAAEMLSGTAPEGHLYLIGSGSGGDFYDMVSKGYLAFWDNAMALTGIDMTAEHYNKINVEIGRLNDKAWSLGIGFSRVGSVVIYNKSLVLSAEYDIAGLISSDQWNWDKVTEIAKVATKRNNLGEITQWGIGMSASGVKGLVLSNGGNLVHPDSNGKFISHLNQENTRQALTQVYNWNNVDRVSAYFSDGVWSSGNSAFANGKVAMYFADFTALKSISENMKAEEFGIAYLPKGPKAQRYVSYMSDGYSYVAPAIYQNITTELMFLVDELHSYDDNYTRDTAFKNEYSYYLSQEEQYSEWYNMYFGNNVVRRWEGSDKLSLAGDKGLSIESLVNGTSTPVIWAATNHNIYTENADLLSEKYKYTGSLK